MTRPRNQMSRKAAAKLQTDLSRTTGGRDGTTWRWWQTTVGKILAANYFDTMHLPQLPTKRLNQRLRKGWPDWFAWGRKGRPSWGRIIVIECKTGRGAETAEQSKIVRALLAVPGVDGGTFYPEDRERLVALCGGNEVGG